MNENTVDILNSAECEKIVKNTLKIESDESVKIINYTLERGSEELVGFMGEYYKLQINVENKHSSDGVQKLYYFVKSVPTKNEYQRAECQRKGFFDKEVCAYTKILPNMQKYASTKLYAKCFYARKDLLVLEDLTAPHLNYRHLKKDEPFTTKHLKLFLKHLSHLHASTIAWEEKENVNIGQQFKDNLFELMLTTKNDWYITSVKGIMYLAKKYLNNKTPSIQALINQKLYDVLMSLEKYTKPSSKARNVFLHRDSWERNIFYEFDEEYEPTSCCIVDFQLIRYAPPPLDILYYLYEHITLEERKSHMQKYIDYYWSELQERFRELNLSSDTITRAEFMEECRRAQLPALVLIATTKPLTMMPEGLSNKWRAEDHEKFDYYMNSDRHEMFERIMKIDPLYKTKIMWPIEELIEYLLKNEHLLI